MTTALTPRMRASDAERERAATRVQEAGAEGRLTLAEIDERLGAVYASTYSDELTAFTADLPERGPRRPRAGVNHAIRHPGLRIHAGIVVLLSALFIVRWVASGVPYFWPLAPMLWLALSLVVHAKVRTRRLTPA